MLSKHLFVICKICIIRFTFFGFAQNTMDNCRNTYLSHSGIVIDKCHKNVHSVDSFIYFMYLFIVTSNGLLCQNTFQVLNYVIVECRYYAILN